MSAETDDRDSSRAPAIAAYDHEDTVVFYDVENPDTWLQIHEQEVWPVGDLV